ncbi:hypothetical protein PAXRUDRAFT_829956 [Paxillus rubicundulus Ve08.2h10]|uniref:Uncharacterized protein n=1 Tax=Paxillus rubicundulus Ve08.2h10 TaxID=930991 RepID=A0A0D0E510_9AGAM|nr:hypothetical protein PAXRUDRAFT_829956 [Paxillus rubicundulus Ve08.2h10]
MSSATYESYFTPLIHINEALALSPPLTPKSLTPEERAAMRKSDRKAEKLLGVTLTRDVKSQTMPNLEVGRAPLTIVKSTRANGGSIVGTVQNLGIGALMAVIGAKRARSRQFSNITLVGALKDLGSMSLGRTGRKKRCIGATHPPRVALGSLRDGCGAEGSSSGSSTAGSEGEDASPPNSFLELDEEEYIKTPTFADFSDTAPEDDEDEDEEGEEEEFVWDVANPFAAPENPAGHQILQEHFAKLRLGDSVGPLDQPTTYESLSFNLEHDKVSSPPSPARGSRRSSYDLWGSDDNLGILPGDLEYVNSLLEMNEAEKEAIPRRKEKRAMLRSRLKKLAILGNEARVAVDRETSQ